METGSQQHPDYAAALEAELVVARAERAAALAELAVAKAKEPTTRRSFFAKKSISKSFKGSCVDKSRNGPRG